MPLSNPTEHERNLRAVTYDKVKEIRVVNTDDHSKVLPIENLTIAGTKVTVAVEGIDATDVNGALAEHQADIETLGTEKANAANPVFSGNVQIPDADADNEAVSKGQMDTADEAYYAKSVEMIAHNATAPSPVIPTGTTKTYEFSSGGSCAWITGGAVTVEVGDKVSAAFTEPSTWVYTYHNVLKRKADATVIGDIDTILDILNGDLEGDIQAIIDNMEGV